MPTCGACGRESPEGFGFCPACGSPLSMTVPERRKLATLLFCDVSGSTAMGERVDAESVRELMFRYFHTMRNAIERHGGTVEKFVGDAVMAVFGVPVAHEDDALRAVRAAWEMQQQVGGLNEELLRRVGSTIALRIGVYTGEVVAGDSSTRETFVTGDAVNTAARLEQAASPGEVLIGKSTFRLVRDAVDVDPVDPVAAKGKAEPVPAYRLRAVRSLSVGRERRHGSKLVGRRGELAMLRDELMQAFGVCRMASVIGEPGVGKSRLVKELLRGSDALVLEGRCLSYGEGITYWPLAEIMRTAAGIHDESSVADAREQLAALAREPAVATPLELALGLGEGSTSPETIAWATRRVLERLSEERPVVVVLDDLHWAEEALLDLVEHVASHGRGRILIVGLARPELLESRPEWPGTIVRLAPLSAADVDSLAATLGVAEAELARVHEAAGGNPLFIEELAAMLADDPDAAVPATLEELLGARLDRLARPEREAAERGSVEGQVFHRGAVEALSVDEGAVRDAIERLTERDLCVAAEAAFADDAAFRFRHILIRDAAYRGIAKRLRAELHERFADWLSRRAEDRIVEVEEIVGYHLEQACCLLAELGPLERTDLSDRASARLAAAGTRAVGRGDLAAGVKLFERAATLATDRRARAGLALESAMGLLKLARFESAETVLTEVLEHARALEDERLELAARVELTFVRTVHGTATGDELFQTASAAASRLGELGAPLERARALIRACIAQVWRQQLEFVSRTGREALEAVRRAGGRGREAAEVLEWLSLAHAFGPDPIEDDDLIVREVVERSAEDRSVEWFALLFFAISRTYRGEFDEARELIERSKRITTELGLLFNHACTSMQLAFIELSAGDLVNAERELRRAHAELQHMNAENPLASIAAYLALVLSRHGDVQEVFVRVEQAERVSADDLEPRILAGAARARALATAGRLAEAEDASRATLALWEGTDNVFLGAQALAALAHVLQLRGTTEEARETLARELAIHVRKRNIPGAERTRLALAAL